MVLAGFKNLLTNNRLVNPVKKWLKKNNSGRNQDLVDVYRYSVFSVVSSVYYGGINVCNRAALVFRCYDHCVENNLTEPQHADIDRFYEEMDQLSSHSQREFVHNRTSIQLIPLFQRLLEAEQRGQPLENVDFGNFSLEMRQSSIPGAGKGVFVRAKKTLVPGTVVALYPGLVHLAEYVRLDGYLDMLLPDPDFQLIVRVDSAIIDGRTDQLVPKNPLALGHMFNHCGDDRFPNVLQVSQQTHQCLLCNLH